MKLDNLLDRIRNHPIGIAIEREDREANLSSRRQIIADLAQLDRNCSQSLLQMRKRTAETLAAVSLAREALAVAERNHADLVSEESRVRLDFDLRRGRLDQELRALADPAIDIFINESLTEFDRTRASCRAQEHWKTDWRNDTRKPIIYSNSKSVGNRLAAIRAACEQAENLKVAGLDVEEIATTLKALKNGLPPIADTVIESRIGR
jgi:hypothetical protein